MLCCNLPLQWINRHKWKGPTMVIFGWGTLAEELSGWINVFSKCYILLESYTSLHIHGHKCKEPTKVLYCRGTFWLDKCFFFSRSYVMLCWNLPPKWIYGYKCKEPTKVLYGGGTWTVKSLNDLSSIIKFESHMVSVNIHGLCQPGTLRVFHTIKDCIELRW